MTGGRNDRRWGPGHEPHVCGAWQGVRGPASSAYCSAVFRASLTSACHNRVEPSAASHMFVVHGKACEKRPENPTCSHVRADAYPSGKMYIVDMRAIMGMDWRVRLASHSAQLPGRIQCRVNCFIQPYIKERSVEYHKVKSRCEIMCSTVTISTLGT